MNLSVEPESVDLTWQTEPITYRELPQITDEYVIHARGFVINEDIWFDPYAVRFWHSKFFECEIADHYGFEWEGNSLHFEQYGDAIETLVYFTITAAPHISLVRPPTDELTSRSLGTIVALFDALEVPGTTRVSWFCEEPRNVTRPESVEMTVREVIGP